MRQLLALLTITFLFPASVSAQSTAESLHQLFDQTWAQELRDQPLFATSIGVHDYNHRLPDVSPEAYAARAEADREALATLLSIDRDGLDDGDKHN